MKKTKPIFIYIILTLTIALISACAGEQGPEGPQGFAGDTGPQGEAGPVAEAAELGCTECHDDTTMITGKQTAWSTSLHGSGTAYDYAGGRASCAGCHSGGAFSARIEEGLGPHEVEVGDPNPTRQDCRACHQIHTTYTKDDFGLETTDPVAFFAIEGETFDGGKGNLCVACHQPRRDFPEAVDGIIEVTSTHWGPHHGPQSSMLLGLAGGGDVEGSPSKHATKVEDTCVACHMGEGQSHSFEPQVAACLECHEDIKNFDVNGVQTEVQALLDELKEILIARGLLDEEGHPAVMSMPEDEAAAVWNWIYIAHEDKSMGVHNPSYTIDLLEWSLAVFE